MNEETPASLKIAQPFMAGFTVITKSKVPQGRQKMVAVRKHLSSLPGLGNVCATKPSAKALGYCRRQKPNAGNRN
jgi:hypothetical protein